MTTQVFAKARTPSAGRGPGLHQRAASAFLLLGWLAFWVAATLQPCCKLPVATAHLAFASSVSQSAAVDHHGNADHHAPASGGICNDVTIVASAAAATAAQAFGGKQLVHASVIAEGHAVRQAIRAVAIELPPPTSPRPLLFHQRTSRILV